MEHPWLHFYDPATPHTLTYLDVTLDHFLDEAARNDPDRANLQTIRALDVEYLSIGVEALQDRHLRTLGRPYTAAEAQTAIARAVSAGFKSVNVDLICALPGQTHAELRAEEVPTLTEWVWAHRHQIGGMTFLPVSEARYAQPPYVKITS